MNMSSPASSTPSPNPTGPSNGGSSGPPSAGTTGQTSNNSSINSGPQQSSNSNNAPVSRERIAVWITELLSSTTREAALMELSRKREKVADLAVLLWHSFGSVAVLLHEVMSVIIEN
jgi:CCR4-NOT transcription complex subunit 9